MGITIVIGVLTVLGAALMWFLGWWARKRWDKPGVLQAGISEDRVYEIVAEFMAAQPKPMTAEQVERLLQLQARPSAVPNGNGHKEEDAEEDAAIYWARRAAGKAPKPEPQLVTVNVAAAVAPAGLQVVEPERKMLMCKCGDGPHTETTLRQHIAEGARRREKGKHGWPSKENR